MYKVIIVDDETTALEQLVSVVEWELFGFEVCGVFDDGASALKHLENEHTDLVITDIRMPAVDGIALAKYCYENKPDTFVALISSYDNFEYARQVVRYNIVDYILKPFSYAQITELLEHAHMMLDNKHSDSFATDEEQLQREKFFSDLFFGNIKSEVALSERLELINQSENMADMPAVLITLSIENFDSYLKDNWKYGKDRFYCAISNMSFENTDEHLFCTMMYSHNNIRIIGVNKNKKENLYKASEDYCNRISKNLEDIMNVKCKIKISREFASLRQIADEDDVFEAVEVNKEENIKNKIIEYMKNNYLQDITLADLAEHMRYNKVYFCSFYKKYMNENFTTTINRMRVEKAKELLKKSDVKASSLYISVGYKSAPYFYKIFKSFTGKTPADYQSEMNKENDTN